MKLDLDIIFFIYDGIKINLEANLYVGQQFNIESGKEKRIEILVFQENLFTIIFKYRGLDYIIGVKETEKMENVLKKFESKANIYLQNIFMTYSGNVLEKEIGSKTIDQIMNRTDREQKAMTILVNDIERFSIASKSNERIGRLFPPNDNNENGSINDDGNEAQENELHILLLNAQQRQDQERNEEDQHEIRVFYFKNLLILGIEHIIILITLSSLLFLFQIDQKLNEADISPVILFIPLFGLIFVLSIIINDCLLKYKKSNYLVILNIIYSLFMIYFGLVLSIYTGPKYIVIGLTLVLLEILSLIINVFFHKKYQLLNFGINASLLSLVALVIFSALWIKELYPIIFISLFWVFSVSYYLLCHLSIKKLCELNEYFYSSLIFNFGIFLAIAFGFAYIIKLIYIWLRKLFSRLNSGNLKTMKPIHAILIQFGIIIILVLIGFAL